MPLDLSSIAVGAKNAIYSSKVWHLLLAVDIPGESTIRLALNTEDVTWASNTWTAFPAQLSPITEAAAGEVPSAALTVSNASRSFQTYLDAHDGMVGATVTSYVVHEDNIADPTPERTVVYRVLSSAVANETVVFQLGIRNPMSKPFPRPRMTRNSCQWKFRGPGCGFKDGLLAADTTVAFVEGGGGLDTITKGGSATWADLGFLAGMRVRVTGSASNDGEYVIDNLSGTTMSLDAAYDLDAESAGASVTIATICRKTRDDCIANDNLSRIRANFGAEALSQA